jgi:redox-sensitive bicupin YhaK (pirin superfamily)
VINSEIRRAKDRGHADHGWLQSAHSFSFADYHDRDHMHYHSLRVINEDHVAAGRGFAMHAHRDAEIFSYVLSGRIAHKDTLGNGSEVGLGGVQFMSAGAGVRHSEFNPSSRDPLHFLQVWLMPDRSGYAPRYETLQIDPQMVSGAWKLILSQDGRDGSIRIGQDANIYNAHLTAGAVLSQTLPHDRFGYLHVAQGSLDVNGARLEAGDAIKFQGDITLSEAEEADVLLFDLAPFR